MWPIDVGVNTKIISAKKKGDTLKVIEAVAFLDSGNPDRNIFKEYKDVSDPTKKITSVKEIIGKDSTMPTFDEWDQVDEYIVKNSDKFIQYTFTFDMNKNGFYKYGRAALGRAFCKDSARRVQLSLLKLPSRSLSY